METWSSHIYKEGHKGHSTRQLHYWPRRRIRMDWSAPKNNDKLLMGSVYRSPSAPREASLELFEQIRRISDSQPSHLLITGEFNLPDIDWELESSPNSLTNLGTIFMECYRDCFLYQHVMAPTHHRHGCTPTTLDLIFSNEEGMVTDIAHLAPLGASCHNVMKFKFNCYFLTNETHNEGYIWNRADYQAMKSDAELIDWDHELAGKNTQQMRDTFESKLMSLVTEYVPKRIPSKKRSGNKPLWLNDKAYTKVRKKYYSHKRYRKTPEGENYSAYARDRNQAKWEVKRAVREYEKRLALEVKQNPKAFFLNMPAQSSRLKPPSLT